MMSECDGEGREGRVWCFAKSPLNFRLTGCPAAYYTPHRTHCLAHVSCFHDPARFWHASRAVLMLGLSFSLASYHCQLSLVVERVSIVANLGSGVFASQLDSLNKVSQGIIPTRCCTELICQLRSSRTQASQKLSISNSHKVLFRLTSLRRMSVA